jgi:enterochelin esterase-like enzyme
MGDAVKCVKRACLVGAALVILILTGCASQKAPEPPASNVTVKTPSRVISPEVGADRRVTFRLRAPQAQSVVLSGEFLKGTNQFVKGPDGVWSITVGPIEPEIYSYNFTIDGVRTIDPGNPEVKTGSTAGTIASLLEVRGDRPTFYDAQPVPHGEVRTHWYESKSLKKLRRLTVYTPPGYAGEQSRLPILYLLHGANADETAWTKLGRANVILDNLLAAQKIKPFIVVMPFGYGVDPNGSEQRQNTAQFSRDLLEDVIPYVESHYRAETNRDSRAIMGLSMGGGEALSIGLNHLERFSYVGGFSAGIGSATNFPNTYAGLIANPEFSNSQLHLLWLGCGTQDTGHLKELRNFTEFLAQHKINYTLRETEGAHTWIVWRRYLNEVAPMLFINSN